MHICTVQLQLEIDIMCVSILNIQWFRNGLQMVGTGDHTSMPFESSCVFRIIFRFPESLIQLLVFTVNVLPSSRCCFIPCLNGRIALGAVRIELGGPVELTPNPLARCNFHWWLMRNFRGGREFDRQLLSSNHAAAVRLIHLVAAGLLFFNFAPQLLGKAVLAEVRRFRSALTATPRVDAVDITAV